MLAQEEILDIKERADKAKNKTAYTIGFMGNMAQIVTSDDNGYFLVAITPELILELLAEREKLHKDLDALSHEDTEKAIKIEQLEREADWLAAKLEYYNTPHECELCATKPGGWGQPCNRPLNEQHCSKCWREAARKHTQEEQTNGK